MAGMVPEDVYELGGVGDPRVSPDGSTVAYVVHGVDEKLNDYRGAIWLAALDGAEEPRQFTSGVKQDANPRWSPDGRTLAFTSNRDGDTMQLYVVPVAGGEARKLTDSKEDVTQPVWSPDGATIAYAARVPDAAYDQKDEKRREPRRITRLQYKLDDVGWTVDRPHHLFTVPADGSAAPVQLTSGDAEDAAPAWSPDGATIAFVSARHPDWDLEPVNDIYLVDATGGDPRRLTHGGGSFGARLVGARRDAAGGDALPGCQRRPEAHADRHGRCGQRRDAAADGVARPQLRALPAVARARVGRRRRAVLGRGRRQDARLSRRRRRLPGAGAGRRRRARRRRLRPRRRAPGRSPPARRRRSTSSSSQRRPAKARTRVP